MKVNFSASDIDELFGQWNQQLGTVLQADFNETILELPPQLGSGRVRHIKLYPGLEIIIRQLKFCDDLTFEIVSNSDNLFKISEDGNLGLETGASLDYETTTEHNITVSVSDGDKNASAEIKITVNNVIQNLFEEPLSFITTWKTPADGFE